MLSSITLASVDLGSTAQAAYDQNTFVDTGDGEDAGEVVQTPRTRPVRRITPAALPSQFNVESGSVLGRGRGGDRLVHVPSNNTLSFFPRNLVLSENLVGAINKDLGRCVQNAIHAGGVAGNVESINVSQMGGWQDRRINNGSASSYRPWSLHSTGRALDIGRIDVTVNGRVYRIPMTKASSDGRNGRIERAFYKGFVDCWSKSTRTCYGGKTVLDCKYNHLHHDHVHIALPFCPRKPGIAST